MRRKLLVLIASVAAVVAATYYTTQSAGGAVSSGGALFADMDGTSEVGADSKKGAGDPDGWGGAVVTIDEGQVCWGITVANISTPVAAHIHLGGPSEAGPVVVGLTAPSSGDPGASSGCTAVSAEIADAIMAQPRAYYVNVHTGDFPGGAVRGQLGR